eukprot:5736974-Alexandrium_andersonii.AAC.1
MPKRPGRRRSRTGRHVGKGRAGGRPAEVVDQRLDEGAEGRAARGGVVDHGLHGAGRLVDL